MKSAAKATASVTKKSLKTVWLPTFGLSTPTRAKWQFISQSLIHMQLHASMLNT